MAFFNDFFGSNKNIRKNRKSQLSPKSGLHLEPLEERQLLAAASLLPDGPISGTYSKTVPCEFYLNVENIGATNENATLSIEVAAATGSAFNPSFIHVYDSNNVEIPVLSNIENNLKSQLTAIFSEGTYKVVILSDGNLTEGAFTCDVFAPGVQQYENSNPNVPPPTPTVFQEMVSCAAAQQNPALWKPYLKLMYQQKLGVYYSDTLKTDTSLDLNGDGKIDTTDSDISKSVTPTVNVSVSLTLVDPDLTPTFENITLDDVTEDQAPKTVGIDAIIGQMFNGRPATDFTISIDLANAIILVDGFPPLHSLPEGFVVYAGGNLTISPQTHFDLLAAAQNASITFGYTVYDKVNDTTSDRKSISFNVTGINDAPQIALEIDPAAIPSTGSREIPFTDLFSDVDGSAPFAIYIHTNGTNGSPLLNPPALTTEPLRIRDSQGRPMGTIALNTAGTGIVFVPGTDFDLFPVNGDTTVTFGLVVKDSLGASSSQETVSLKVNTLNKPPAFNSGTLSAALNENASITLDANQYAVDPNGTALKFSAVGADNVTSVNGVPQSGTGSLTTPGSMTLADGTVVTLTADGKITIDASLRTTNLAPGATASIQLNVKVTDGTQETASASVINVTINGVNEPFSLAAQSFSVLQTAPADNNWILIGTVVVGGVQPGEHFTYAIDGAVGGVNPPSFKIEADGKLYVAKTTQNGNTGISAPGVFSVPVKVSGDATFKTAAMTVDIQAPASPTLGVNLNTPNTNIFAEGTQGAAGFTASLTGQPGALYSFTTAFGSATWNGTGWTTDQQNALSQHMATLLAGTDYTIAFTDGNSVFLNGTNSGSKAFSFTFLDSAIYDFIPAGASVTFTFNLNVKGDSLAGALSTSSSFAVVVNGMDNAPTSLNVVTSSFELNKDLKTQTYPATFQLGNFTIVDPDYGDATAYSYGITARNSAGTPVSGFTLSGTLISISQTSVENLGITPDESEVFTITLTGTKGAFNVTKEISVTINAAEIPSLSVASFDVDEDNDDSINLGPSVSSQSGVVTFGNLSVSGVSSNLTGGLPAYLACFSLNQAGQLTFSPGMNFDFLPQGETATITLGFTISDDLYNAITTETLTVTVNGVNDGPTAFTIQNSTFELNRDLRTLVYPATFSLGNMTVIDTDSGDDAQYLFSIGAFAGDPGFVLNGNTLSISKDQADAIGITPGDSMVFTIPIVATHTLSPGSETFTQNLTVTIHAAKLPSIPANTDFAADEDTGETFDLGALVTSESTSGSTYGVLTLVSATEAIPGVIDDYASCFSISAAGVLTFAPGTKFDYLSSGESVTMNLSVTASDIDFAVSSVLSFTVTITGINDAPVAVDYTGGTAVDSTSSVEIPLSSLFSDADDATGHTVTIHTHDATGAASTFVLDATAGLLHDASGVPHGTVKLNAAGDGLIYTPGTDFDTFALNGVTAVTFDFHVSDAAAGSTTETVTLSVKTIDKAPVFNAGALTAAVDENASVVLEASDYASDPNGLALTFTSVSAIGVVSVGGVAQAAAPHTLSAAGTMTLSDGTIVTLGSDGKITVDASARATNLDVDATLDVVLGVTVGDGTLATAAASDITVTITGVNEPFGLLPQTFEVGIVAPAVDNWIRVGQVAVVQQQPGEAFTYAITGTVSGTTPPSFMIDAATGEIFVAKDDDTDITGISGVGTFTFTVAVTGDSTTKSALMTIDIIDAAAPVLTVSLKSGESSAFTEGTPEDAIYTVNLTGQTGSTYTLSAAFTSAMWSGGTWTPAQQTALAAHFATLAAATDYGVTFTAPSLLPGDTEFTFAYLDSAIYDFIPAGGVVELTFTVTALGDALGGNLSTSETFTVTVTGIETAPGSLAVTTDDFDHAKDLKPVTDPVAFELGTFTLIDPDFEDDAADYAFAITAKDSALAPVVGFTLSGTTISITQAAITSLGISAGTSGVYTITLTGTKGTDTISKDITIEIHAAKLPSIPANTDFAADEDTGETFDLGALVTSESTSGSTYGVLTLVSATEAIPGVIDDYASCFSISAAGVLTFAPGTKFDYLSSGESVTMNLSVTASDIDFAVSSVLSFTVTITGINDAPVAVDYTGGTAVDSTSSVEIPLSSLFSDADDATGHTVTIHTHDATGAASTFVLDATAGLLHDASGVPHGTVKLNAAGDGLIYTPGTDFDTFALNGVTAVTFDFHVSDAAAGSTTETVTLSVKTIDKAPVFNAGALTAAVDENASVVLEASDYASDPNGLALTFTSVSAIGVVSVGGVAQAAAPHTLSAAGTMTLSDGTIVTLGSDGKITVDASARATNLDVDATLDVVLGVTVGDGTLATAAASDITVTITGVNEPFGLLPQTFEVGIVAPAVDNWIRVGQVAVVQQQPGEAFTYAITGTVSGTTPPSFMIDAATGEIFVAKDDDTDITGISGVGTFTFTVAVTGDSTTKSALMTIDIIDAAAPVLTVSLKSGESSAFTEGTPEDAIYTVNLTGQTGSTYTLSAAFTSAMWSGGTWTPAQQTALAAHFATLAAATDYGVTFTAPSLLPGDTEFTFAYLDSAIYDFIPAGGVVELTFTVTALGDALGGNLSTSETFTVTVTGIETAPGSLAVTTDDFDHAKDLKPVTDPVAFELGTFTLIDPDFEDDAADYAFAITAKDSALAPVVGFTLSGTTISITQAAITSLGISAGTSGVYTITLTGTKGTDTISKDITIEIHAAKLPSIPANTDFAADEDTGETFDLGALVTSESTSGSTYGVLTLVSATEAIPGVIDDYASCFSISAAGVLTFAPGTKFDYLSSGESVTMNLSVTASDIDFAVSSVLSFTVTITGINDAPSSLVIEHNSFTFKKDKIDQTYPAEFDLGQLDFTDADAGQSGDYAFALGTITNDPGFELAAGKLSLTQAEITALNLIPGESRTFIVPIIASRAGEAADTTSANVTITIKASDLPSIETGTNFATDEDVSDPLDTFNLADEVTSEGTSVTFSGLVLTVSTGTLPATYDFSAVGAIDADGMFTFSPGTHFDYLRAGETVVLSYQVNMSDDQYSAVSNGTFTVTVTGVNDAPVAKDHTESALVPSSGTREIPFSALFTDVDDLAGHTLTIHTYDASKAEVELELTTSGVQLRDSDGKPTGTVKLNAADNGLIYIPGTDLDTLAIGTETSLNFKFTVTDTEPKDSANQGTVTLKVQTIDKAPVFRTSGLPTLSIVEHTATPFEVPSAMSFATDSNDPTGTGLTYHAVKAKVIKVGTTDVSPAATRTIEFNATTAQTLTLEDGTVITLGTDGKITIDISARTAPNMNASQSATLSFSVDITDGKSFTGFHPVSLTIDGEDEPLGLVDQVFNTSDTAEADGSDRISLGFVKVDGMAVGEVFSFSIEGAVTPGTNEFSIDPATGELFVKKTGVVAGGFTFTVKVKGATEAKAKTAIMTVNVSDVAYPLLTITPDAPANLGSTEGDADKVCVLDVEVTGEDGATYTLSVALDSAELSGGFTADQIKPFVDALVVGVDYLVMPDGGTPFIPLSGSTIGNKNVTFTRVNTAKYDFIPAGETLTLKFKVTATGDLAGGEFTVFEIVNVTILGTNDDPVLVVPAPVKPTVAANSMIGSKFYLADLAKDIDLGDGVSFSHVNGAAITDITKQQTFTIPGKGTVTYVPNGSNPYLLYKPAGQFTALRYNALETVNFTFSVQDADGGTIIDSPLSVDIKGVNSKPVFDTAQLTKPMSQDKTITFHMASGTDDAENVYGMVSDANTADVLTIVRINGGVIAGGGTLTLSHGTISLSADSKSFTYTPNTSGINSDVVETFSVTVSDDSGATASNTATATVRLNIASTAPEANNANGNFTGTFGDTLLIDLGEHFSLNGGVTGMTFAFNAPGFPASDWVSAGISGNILTLTFAGAGNYAGSFDMSDAAFKITATATSNGQSIDKSFNVSNVSKYTVDIKLSASDEQGGPIGTVGGSEAFSISMTMEDILNTVLGSTVNYGLSEIGFKLSFNPELCQPSDFPDVIAGATADLNDSEMTFSFTFDKFGAGGLFGKLALFTLPMLSAEINPTAIKDLFTISNVVFKRYDDIGDSSAVDETQISVSITNVAGITILTPQQGFAPSQVFAADTLSVPMYFAVYGVPGGKTLAELETLGLAVNPNIVGTEFVSYSPAADDTAMLLGAGYDPVADSAVESRGLSINDLALNGLEDFDWNPLDNGI